MKSRSIARYCVPIAAILLVYVPCTVSAEVPHAIDNRLSIELFAEHPQVVTPTGLAVDARGRVFVAESHTHFRPKDYDGPPADRILILTDTDGDGRADTKTVFHEGFTYVMDIEFHHDGSLYVATRMDIHRMRDTDGDDRADEITPIVRMETKGNYPHNGLSGIAFDLAGGFHFGLGENLGEVYTIEGSDGQRLSGGGEGGSTYWIDDRGRGLRRVSTGWWNPYGMCVDSFGRVFGTDNDPDASPPCRLIQVVPGGDYGYEFRYGRSGRNPLVAWDAEIPGTLPMIAGTGEAPCHIVSYESDALPVEYFGHLLVPSWADHRIEHFGLTQAADRGLVTTQRQTLIDGPDDFRPVGIDVAPDGSIYLSDWVSSSYTLHKQGRIWRVRAKQPTAIVRPKVAADAVQVHDRRVREAAARDLVRSPSGRAVLERQAREAALAQSRATCLFMLATTGQNSVASELVGNQAAPVELRMVAARIVAADHRENAIARDDRLPLPVRTEALFAAGRMPLAAFDHLFDQPDPLLRHAAVGALARSLTHPDVVGAIPEGLPELPLLLSIKRSQSANRRRAHEKLTEFLRSTNQEVRFAAVKWVADDQLTSFGPQLESMLADPSLDLANFLAIHVALQRLRGQPPSDRPPPERLVEKIVADDTPLNMRRLALRLIDPTFAGLSVVDLGRLVDHADESLRKEAVRTLAEHSDQRRFKWLTAVARDPRQPAEVRANAVAGLAIRAEAHLDLLVDLTRDASYLVRDEALRSLVGMELNEEQRAALRRIASPATAEAVARIVDKRLPVRPGAEDIDGWLAALSMEGDAATGERIFFGAKVGTCSKCHQAQGRGAAVGADLSRMSERVAYASAGNEGRRWLLATILQPSRDMAPQFTPWLIVTKDGKQYTGLPRRKGGNSEAYLGSDGREFTLKKADIEFHRESPVSIMPAELLQQLTGKELADLFAFLLLPRR